MSWPGPIPPLDIFGGADQRPEGFVPPSMACVARSPEVPAPASAASWVPAACLLADYLAGAPRDGAAPRFEIRRSGSWADIEMIEHPKTRDVIGKSAKLVVTVTVSHDGVVVAARSLSPGRIRWFDKPDDPSPDPQPSFYVAERWDRLRQRFDTGEAADVVPSPGEQAARDAHVAQTAAAVEEQLAAWRAQFASSIAGRHEDREIRTLSGAKALIRDFLSLGLPVALEADGYLRMFLEGREGLPDGDTVSQEYARAAAGEVPQGRAPNPRDRLVEDAAVRAAALGDVIQAYLLLIADGSWQEGHREIERALTWSRLCSYATQPDVVAATPPAAPAESRGGCRWGVRRV